MILILTTELLEIPPRDSILHWNQDGFWAHDGSQIINDWLYLMRLYRQNNNVRSLGIPNFFYCLYLGNQRLWLVIHNQRQTTLFDCRKCCAARNHRHIIARSGQHDSQIAANGATSPDHTNFHRNSTRIKILN